MVKKKTNNQFIKEVYNLVGGEYTLLGDYINDSTHINIKHEICDYNYSVSPSNFLRGRRCPKCAGNIRKTQDEFENNIFNLVGNEYVVLGKYKNNRTGVKMMHIKCRHVWSPRPSEFICGNRCPNCNGTMLKTQEVFEKEVVELVGNEYVVTGKYINSQTDVTIEHIICGYEYSVTPNSFLRGLRCPRCNIGYKRNSEIFKHDVYNLVGYEYTVLGEYIEAHTKVKIKHNICNHEWSPTPNSFLRGHRCPKCNLSKGESKAYKWLDGNNTLLGSQYKFADCKNIKQLPFDFAILDKNEHTILIEYDGKQHFEPIEYYGGEEKFKERQRNDQIKNQYCIDNNIPLYRIPYWEFDNIESILENLIYNTNNGISSDSFLVS